MQLHVVLHKRGSTVRNGGNTTTKLLLLMLPMRNANIAQKDTPYPAQGI